MSGSLRPGFALIDAVAGMMIAAMTVLLAHATLTTWLDTNRRAEHERARSIEAVAVRRQLVSWVRAAAVTSSARRWDFFGVNRAAAGGGADGMLALLTDAPGPFDDGRLELTLAIDRDPATPEQGLVAFAGTPADALVSPVEIDSTAVRLQPLAVLVPGATGMTVRFLHRVENSRAWTYEWSSSAQLPDAVEIMITGDSIPAIFSTGVFIVPRGVH